jgi:hypothetical protein
LSYSAAGKSGPRTVASTSTTLLGNIERGKGALRELTEDRLSTGP